tara:strand:+ start:599 stop:898 length:300 start_codon:yes stop_codon:yes gene_type:complete
MSKDNEKVLTEEEIHTNSTLAMPVVPDSELKTYLVGYTGEKFDKEQVTVNMIAETLATDFPEFTLAFAEENFLRGYQLGLEDAEQFYKEKAEAAARATD